MNTAKRMKESPFFGSRGPIVASFINWKNMYLSAYLLSNAQLSILGFSEKEMADSISGNNFYTYVDEATPELYIPEELMENVEVAESISGWETAARYGIPATPNASKEFVVAIDAENLADIVEVDRRLAENRAYVSTAAYVSYIEAGKAPKK